MSFCNTTEAWAWVEDALDVNTGAWNVRCGDRTYPDVCTFPELRWVLLSSRMGNKRGSRPKYS